MAGRTVWSRLRGGGKAAAAEKTAPQRKGRERDKRGGSRAEVVTMKPGSSWLGTLVVGCWDNTCGPRIDQIWHGTEGGGYEDELLLYAVRLTLASEIGPDASAAGLAQKFHLFGELGLLIVSTSFAVHSSHDVPTKYALVLLCSSALLPRYLHLSDIVEDRMFRLASALQQLLERRLPGSGHAAHLLRFVKQLDALFAAGSGPAPVISPPSAPDPALLALALTAHVQAGCRTVVMGSSPDAVMRMIVALQPFACPHQIPLQHLSVATSHVPDLALQGVLLSRDPAVSAATPVVVASEGGGGGVRQSPAPLTDAQLFQSLHPCCLVLLDSAQVFATAFAPEYAVLRREHVASEIAGLLAGHEEQSAQVASALRPVRRQSQWAADVVATLARLPLALRSAYAAARWRALTLRALALCRATSGRHLERAVLGPPASVAPSAAPSDAGSAGGGTLPDFLVLLGLADALAPGTYVRLAGDPDVLESKFVELFESF